MTPKPVIEPKRGISPVWILPITALIICSWILFSSYRNAGIEISIFFEDASGITPGKTQVMTRGIPIGQVTRLVPDIGNRRIQAFVKMDKSVSSQLVKDTLFWIVRPEISAASIEGLDTLLSGSYIGISPGSSTIASREYIGLSSPPPISEDAPGLHIKLRADELGSIQDGAEVYFRNITIGSVTKHSLEEDESILIGLYIKPDFAHLVREGSRFYNASGLSISGKLTNLKVKVESLTALLKGGIVLHTPEALASTKTVKNGHIFKLYKDLEAAQYGIHMRLQLASSQDITEGQTKVIYRGMVAGVVDKITFNHDELHSVTAQVILDPRAGRILRSGTQFWIVRPHLTTEGIENLNTLLAGPFITFKPGTGEFQNEFEILPEPPPQNPLRPGSELVLTAPQSFSIQKGAPVTYKNKKVGEVLDIEPDEELNNFEILIFIYEEYEKLVSPYSVFWNTSGISLDASVSGVHLRTNSLSGLISGGIGFLTPNTPEDNGGNLPPNVVFWVHDNYEAAVEATPALQPTGYHFRLASSTPESFRQGTPIFYRKVKVGKVQGFSLSRDGRSVMLDCLIYNEFSKTINDSSRFYTMAGLTIEGGLSGVTMQTATLESLATGAIGFYTPDFTTDKSTKKIYTLYPGKKEAESIDRATVTVRFKECRDLREGSPVKYKGVAIGSVISLAFDEDMHHIVATLQIDRPQTLSIFRAETKIWLEKAEVNLSGIRNLKTILFGPYVNVLPGKGEPCTDFTALVERPTTPVETSGGLDITLESSHKGSLKINSPVLYRQIPVGRVVDYRLSDDFTRVMLDINIAPRYSALIRENTRFWNVSGTKIEGGLFSGVSVATESLESLISGGIALATPNREKMGPAVQAHHIFHLYESAEEEWLDWKPEISLIEEEAQKDLPAE